MAYRDPYTEQYRDHPYDPQPQHGESASDFNPYTTKQSHPTYEQGGMGSGYDNYDHSYRDDGLSDPYESGMPPQRRPTQQHYQEEPAAPGLAPVDSDRRVSSGFDHGEFTSGRPREYVMTHTFAPSLTVVQEICEGHKGLSGRNSRESMDSSECRQTPPCG